MALPKSARVEIRVTETEKAAWAEAAGGARRVSEWLRSLANEAAFADKNREGRASSELGPADHRLVVSAPLDATAPTGPKGKVSIRNGAKPVCPRAHFHRAGTYCGSCGTLQ